MAWLTKWISDEWKSAWKWLQVQLAVLIVAAPVLYENLATLQQYIPTPVFRYGMSALGVLIILNTIRRKKAETPTPPPGPPV